MTTNQQDNRSQSSSIESDRECIIEEIPFGVWACGPDGGLRYASESFLKLLDMTMEEASGFGWTKRVATEDKGSIERWRRCVHQKQDWDDEHQIKDPAGNVKTLLARGHAVKNSSGEIEQWIGVHLDITKRKETEQRLQDSRDFARAIIETVPEPLVVLDEDLKVVTLNRAFIRCFETPRQEAKGESFSDLGDNQWDVASLQKLIEETLTDNDAFDDYELVHQFPNLGRRVMLISGRRIQRKVHKTRHILLIIRDVTEARQKANWRRIANEMQAVQQERQRIASRLHDHLQQLLIAAAMHVEMAKEGQSDSSNENNLINAYDLLQESIKAARDLAVEVTPPVLAESGLKSALEWLAKWMETKHQLRVFLQIAPDVEPEDYDISLLLFDAARELLLNVIKHANVTTATVTASLKENQLLRLIVRDKGRGFNPEGARKAGESRQGFGLSSLRQRIEAIGGSIDIDSDSAGTKVTVEVQLKKE